MGCCSQRGTRRTIAPADSDEEESTDDDEPETFNKLQEFENGPYWQWFINCVILFNTAVLSMEADNPHLPWASAADNVFLSIFCVELTFRLLIYGCSFFCNENRGWNWFDTVVVVFGVVDQWLLPILFPVDVSMSSAVAALRVVRLLRVLRTVRLLKQFKPLRLLATGLINSLSSVFWIAMLFLALVFTSAIFTTNIIGREADRFRDPEAIRRWFGSMPRSMETLSIFLTCDDWSTAVRMVNEQYPWMELFWVWYMVMGAFLVLSLLTGLMADKMKSARDEYEDAEKTKPEKFERTLDCLRVKFASQEAEIDQDKFVNEVVREPKINKALADAGLKDMDEHQQAWLFRAIDRDCSKSLSWDELSDALMQISRHSSPLASPLEIMKIEGVLVRLDRKLREWRQSHEGQETSRAQAHSWDRRLEAVQARSSLLKARIRALHSDLQAFFRDMDFDPSMVLTEQ